MDNGAQTAPEARAETWAQVQDYLQASVIVLLGALVIGMVVVTLMSVVGVLPWLQIDARLGTVDIPAFGPALQVLFTLFCLALLAVLPSSARVLKLEQTRRDFTLTLDDLENAYRAAHQEDRAGAFTLSEEFNAVRERLNYLKRHPDLANLEPEILEIAAQMSFLARDLATVYSDDAITRAKAFLNQRQQEVVSHRERISAALGASQELRLWLDDVEADERDARRMIARLDVELRELLPRIGYQLDADGAKVLPLAIPASAREQVEG